mgnify:CR=1 FL=1
MAEAEKIEKEEKAPAPVKDKPAAENADAPKKMPLSLRFAIFVLMWRRWWTITNNAHCGLRWAA